MNIIEKLPDDLIIYIYTKILKTYKFRDGKLVRQIDLEKYKFLEKYLFREIEWCYGFLEDFVEDELLDVVNMSIPFFKMRFKLKNLEELPDRKEQYVEDDMMDIEIKVFEDRVEYDVQTFKLKRIENLTIKPKINMYFRGDYKEYNWDHFHYKYKK